MEERNPATAAMEWRAHWPLVLVSMLGFGLGTIPAVTIGLFMVPLEREFGWDRAEITSGLLIYSLVSIVGQPIVGRMIDRWGPRRIGLPGIVLSGGAIALFSLTGETVVSWWIHWLIFSLAVQLALSPVWSAAVAGEFQAGRGLALAVALSGSTLVSIVAPVIATGLIDGEGWRMAYLLLGLCPTIVIAFLAFLFFRTRPRASRADPATAARDSEAARALARHGLRSPVFFKIMIAMLVGFPVVTAIGIHLVPILSSGGMSRDQAAVVLSVYGALILVGRLGCGLLVVRMPGYVIAAGLSILPIGSCLLLIPSSDSIVGRIVAVSFLAFSAGGQIKMLPYLTSRYFDLRAFGAIFGVISTTITFSAGAGPLIAGWLFDLSGNYRTLLMICIPPCLIAGLLMLWIGDYPAGAERSDEAFAAG